MATNSYFTHNASTGADKTVIENLVVESIKMVGFETWYLPRTQTNIDPLLQEAEQDNFTSAYEVEMYFDAPDDALADSVDYITYFGFEVRDSCDFVIAVKRFDDLNISGYTLPLEGDLIYLPFTKQIYEIKFVEDMTPFMQLGKNYIYKLMSRLFIYGGQNFNVNTSDSAVNTAINAIETERSHIITAFTLGTGSGTYAVDSVVYQGVSLATATAQATVTGWDVGTKKLSINNIVGSFTPGVNVVENVGVDPAIYTFVELVQSTTVLDPEAQNIAIETIADAGIVDFTETNPFGEF